MSRLYFEHFVLVRMKEMSSLFLLRRSSNVRLLLPGLRERSEPNENLLPRYPFRTLGRGTEKHQLYASFSRDERSLV